MASQVFGTDVKPEHVIDETLVRTTNNSAEDEQFLEQLTERVKEGGRTLPRAYWSFTQDPLSTWIEDTFGVMQQEDRLVRTKPKSISGEKGAAGDLSSLTREPVERCVEAIQHALLTGYECEPHPETGSPPFAFRLHQFISKGDTMNASLEEERYLTLQRQQYVPGDRQRVLLPLVFCRECGQEYYCVRLQDGQFTPRELNDQVDDEGQAGFLYYSQENPWPIDEDSLQRTTPRRMARGTS